MAMRLRSYFKLYISQTADQQRWRQWRLEAASQLEMRWSRDHSIAGRISIPHRNQDKIIVNQTFLLHLFCSPQVLASISTHLHVSKDPALGQVSFLRIEEHQASSNYRSLALSLQLEKLWFIPPGNERGSNWEESWSVCQSITGADK